MGSWTICVLMIQRSFSFITATLAIKTMNTNRKQPQQNNLTNYLKQWFHVSFLFESWACLGVFCN
ncbi:uncharacterized protein DS421_6g173280 [Arachis hypogaea]|nr:uncharacterized protein DS421_6g173280 [Arachis hypogaea]